MPEVKSSKVDEKKIKELLKESTDQVWESDFPHTQLELRNILKSLNFDREKFLTHKDALHHLVQEARTYKKHTLFDALADGITLQDYFKNDPIGDPKINKIRNDIEDIEKSLKNFPESLHALNKIAYLSVYFSEKQIEAINLFVKLMPEICKIKSLLKKEPFALNNFRGKTGNIEYLALNLFARELMEIYRTITGRKGSISPSSTNIGDDNDDEYVYNGKFNEFIRACILPLSETHKTERKIGHFLTNVLKIQRKNKIIKKIK